MKPSIQNFVCLHYWIYKLKIFRVGKRHNTDEDLVGAKTFLTFVDLSPSRLKHKIRVSFSPFSICFFPFHSRFMMIPPSSFWFFFLNFADFFSLWFRIKISSTQMGKFCCFTSPSEVKLIGSSRNIKNLPLLWFVVL